MSKAKTNGDRHNGFGSKPSGASRSLAGALDLTRRHIAQLGPAKAFAPVSDQWATQDWVCVNGHANPMRKLACKYCGEMREDQL